MPRPLSNYLRTFRRAAGLTQKDMAYLLSLPNASQVSRIERGIKEPGLRASFAYEIVFHAALRRLFAGLYGEVEKETLKRTKRLLVRLRNASKEQLSLRKQQALKAIVDSQGDVKDLPR